MPGVVRTYGKTYKWRYKLRILFPFFLGSIFWFLPVNARKFSTSEQYTKMYHKSTKYYTPLLRTDRRTTPLRMSRLFSSVSCGKSIKGVYHYNMYSLVPDSQNHIYFSSGYIRWFLWWHGHDFDKTWPVGLIWPPYQLMINSPWFYDRVKSHQWK